jgi:adenylate kinase
VKLVFLGPPGAGKGTQAVKIAASKNIPHISTGDIFRENLKNETPLGLKAKEYMASGGLVPDGIVLEIVMDRLAKNDCEGGYLLDGFPRTLPQAKGLDDALAAKSEKLDHVIYFETSDNVVVERLTGRRTCRECGAIYHIKNIPPKVEGVCDKCSGELYQRDDDTLETVKNRLAVYREQTAELIDYYRRASVLMEVSGDKGVEELFTELDKRLGNEELGIRN